jgi:hypothetical protein
MHGLRGCELWAETDSFASIFFLQGHVRTLSMQASLASMDLEQLHFDAVSFVG